MKELGFTPLEMRIITKVEKLLIEKNLKVPNKVLLEDLLAFFEADPCFMETTQQAAERFLYNYTDYLVDYAE